MIPLPMIDNPTPTKADFLNSHASWMCHHATDREYAEWQATGQLDEQGRRRWLEEFAKRKGFQE